MTRKILDYSIDVITAIVLFPFYSHQNTAAITGLFLDNKYSSK